MTQIPSGLSDPKLKQVLDAGPLAPDGLPWPEGYFDRIPPRETIEEATERYGVRPTRYFHGRAGYTTEEWSRPEFKVKLPDEPEEVQELYQKWAEAGDCAKLEKDAAD